MATTAEMNARNRGFWSDNRKRQSYLIERKYIQNYLREGLTDSRLDDGNMVRRMMKGEVQFHQVIFDKEDSLTSSASFRRQRENARKPRITAEASGRSIVEIIAEFASRPLQRTQRTVQLWDGLGGFLTAHSLEPELRTHKTDPGKWAYRYRLESGYHHLSYRRFENIISKVSPRRNKLRSVG
jgi:hypothetical protein